MNKIERFYNSLGEPVQANNGDYGYFVTVGDLVKNGGENEFFRKVRKSDKKVSKAVFYGLEYDKCDRAYYAANWDDCSSHSGPLKKTDVVFIGFDF